jgi:hypothetical protein
MFLIGQEGCKSNWLARINTCKYGCSLRIRAERTTNLAHECYVYNHKIVKTFMTLMNSSGNVSIWDIPTWIKEGMR